jgi:hypothetical protein
VNSPENNINSNHLSSFDLHWRPNRRNPVQLIATLRSDSQPSKQPFHQIRS